MVRINLMGAVHPTRRFLLASARRTGVAAAVILVVISSGASWWSSLRRTSNALDAAVAAAEADKQQRQADLAKEQELDDRRTQLRRRVAAMEEIPNHTAASLFLLEDVAEAVPPDLWLVEFTQKGSVLTLQGLTTRLSTVSDFVANLERSASFRPPLEILNTEMTTDPVRGALVKFSIKAAVDR